jgi:hypothetical protein
VYELAACGDHAQILNRSCCCLLDESQWWGRGWSRGSSFFGITEDARLFAEGEIAGDNYGGALVKARLIRLNRGCPPDWAKARVYAHWLYAACYDLAADSKQGPIDTQPASHQLVLSALQSIKWREMALDSDNGKD